MWTVLAVRSVTNVPLPPLAAPGNTQVGLTALGYSTHINASSFLFHYGIIKLQGNYLHICARTCMLYMDVYIHVHTSMCTYQSTVKCAWERGYLSSGSYMGVRLLFGHLYPPGCNYFGGFTLFAVCDWISMARAGRKLKELSVTIKSSSWWSNLSD